MRNTSQHYPIYLKYGFLRDEKLMTNLMLAYLAIKFVKKTVSYDAANRPDSTIEAMLRMCLSLHWQDEQKKINGAQSQEISTVMQAKAAYQFRVANCEGQASCAFGYLLTHLNISNMEIFRLQRDHSFLVIGRDPQSEVANYATWNKSAVICDPWANRYFPATELRVQLNDIFVEAQLPKVDAADPLICHKLYSYQDMTHTVSINQIQSRLTFRELNKLYDQYAASLVFSKSRLHSPIPMGFFKKQRRIILPAGTQMNPWRNGKT